MRCSAIGTPLREDRISRLPPELLDLILALLDVIPFGTVDDPLKALADTNLSFREVV